MESSAEVCCIVIMRWGVGFPAHYHAPRSVVSQQIEGNDDHCLRMLCSDHRQIALQRASHVATAAFIVVVGQSVTVVWLECEIRCSVVSPMIDRAFTFFSSLAALFFQAALSF